MSDCEDLALGKNLQVVFTSIPDIRVSAVAIRIRVLPEALVGPATRNGAHRAGITSQDEWIVMAKGSTASGAGIPPICRCVNHRIPTGLAFVCLAKVLDPGDHGRGTQAVAGGSRGVVLDIEHPRKGDAIIRPTSTVSQEEVGLSGS